MTEQLLTPCRVGEIPFEVTTLDGAVTRTLDDALSERSSHLHFANAWSIVLANDDTELCEAFRRGTNYPDGKPVVWAMNWLRGRNTSTYPSRVDGPSFFETALEEGVSRGVRHYFFGSTIETLDRLQNNVRNRFPGIEIAGVSSPPFRDLTPEDFARELAKIQECGPHIVWVGLGTPKQDKAAAHMAREFPGVLACVGAAFDYTAGNLRAAPSWVQDAGLGWLYRLIQEPKRLWRRYLIGNAKFIQIVMMQLTHQR